LNFISRSLFDFKKRSLQWSHHCEDHSPSDVTHEWLESLARCSNFKLVF